MIKIKAIIVDDEPLARERIADLLAKEKDIQIIAECKNGYDALKIVSKQEIDLMFLDVQMPKLDGFATIKEIPSDRLPFIIFTTAYDEYALKAFEINAVDYLLKPFDQKRFQCAVDRIRERMDSKELSSARLLKLLHSLPEMKDYPDKISIKTGDRIIFLPVNEIEWIESEANYIRLYTRGISHVLRETMNNFQSKIDPKVFIRIHRSTIVNFNFVKELQSWFNDNYIVILKNDTKLAVGRSYRKNITSLFHSA